MNRFLRYTPASDEDRGNRGIHKPQPRRAEIPVPITVPELEPLADTLARNE